MNITFKDLKSNGRNMDNKETIQRWNLIAFDDDKFKELATIRWYMGRSASSSVVYCTLWVTSHTFRKTHDDWTDASGSGSAGGGGYCKVSAAFQDALNNAGIFADEGIAGRGDTVVQDCLLALGRQAGFKHVKLVRG